jgi:subtilisin family serine protease
MRPRTTARSARLVALLAAVAVTSAGMVIPAAGEPSSGSDPAVSDPGRAGSEGKFTASALEELQELEQQETTDFWIRFEDQADLSAARDIADWDERGQYVYDALTATAKAAQADVVERLEAAGTDYVPYWISNSILVEDGTLDLAENVATRAAVEGIHEQVVMEHIAPQAQGTTQGATPPTTDDAAAGGVAWGVEAINAPDVWAQGITGTGITVASLDTGVDVEHPALAERYRGRGPGAALANDYNWLDLPGLCDGSPCDFNAHGTHTTGTMVGDDGAGNQVGVAPGASWIAADCVDNCAYDQYLQAAQWMLAPTRADGTDPSPAMRPHVVNNSWGIPASSQGSIPVDWMADEVAAWEAAGIFGVWAAGNEGSATTCRSARLPASFAHTYSVGGFDVDGDLFSGSARGPGDDDETTPDITAPGVDVRSSVPGGGYRDTFTGTSMATPHVSGAVALLWSAAPALIGDIEGTIALLDRTAIDTPDDQCGGVPENNNVWGEGKLDVAALIEVAPVDGTGVLTGTVTDESGAPVVGAELRLGGGRDRVLVTDADGSYSVTVLPGDYGVSASAFGFLPSDPVEVDLADGATERLDITLTTAPRFTLSGTLRDDAGHQLAGATVTVTAPRAPTFSATTDAQGGYTVEDLPDGAYHLQATGSHCTDDRTVDVDVEGDTEHDVTLDQRTDDTGYTCVVGESGAQTGDTQLETTKAKFGGNVATTELPFTFPFYGENYPEVTVSENGWLSFLPQDGAWPNRPGPGSYTLPDGRKNPNAAIFVYHQVFALDDQSGIYTATTTVDGAEAFVIEWRNLKQYSGQSRSTYSATLYADGRVELGYGDSGPDPITGVRAMIGIENAAGTDGFEYAYNAPDAVHEGSSVLFARPVWGRVSGTLVDARDQRPLADVEVRLVPAGGGPARHVWTAADGTYAMSAAPGTYDVSIAEPGYRRVTERIVVDQDLEEFQVSPQLRTGAADVSGGARTLELVQGESTTIDVGVSNIGTARLTASVGTMVPTGSLDAPPGPGAGTYPPSQEEPSAPGAERAPTSRGTAIGAIYSSARIPFGVAVTPDGEVWSSGAGPSPGGTLTVHENYRYSRSGELLDKDDSRLSSTEQLRGLVWNSTIDEMCQAVSRGDGTSVIRCYDDELDVTREIEGAWSGSAAYDVAYNPETDVFYVTVPADDEIVTLAGTTHDEPGKTLSRCVPEGRDAVGLAYNTTSGTLWMSAQMAERALVQLDPADCRTLRVAAAPPDVIDNAVWGLATDVTGNLWIVDRLTQRLRLVDVGDPQLTPVSWVSARSKPAHLLSGQRTRIPVTIDTADLAPGTYTTDLAVVSDAGRAPVVRRSLTVEVVAPYTVAVDVGGPGLTDRAGNVWAADRVLSSEPLPDGEPDWGRFGGSRVDATKKAIARTHDDALYRTARTGAVGYTFRDLPAGSYEVELGLVELRPHPPRGKRVIDVLVDGRAVIRGLDVASEAGGLTALNRTVTVEHLGGDLDVALRPHTRNHTPGLAALSVVQRSVGQPANPVEPGGWA